MDELKTAINYMVAELKNAEEKSAPSVTVSTRQLRIIINRRADGWWSVDVAPEAKAKIAELFEQSDTLAEDQAQFIETLQRRLSTAEKVCYAANRYLKHINSPLAVGWDMLIDALQKWVDEKAAVLSQPPKEGWGWFLELGICHMTDYTNYTLMKKRKTPLSAPNLKSKRL